MSDSHASAPGQVVVDLIDLRRLRAPLLASLDAAEAALIDYGRDKQRREPLLHCLWAAHHISTALGALQLYKAEMLALEMQRGFLRLLRADVVAERRNLEMGGLMRAIKTLPAYLDHVEQVQLDTGRGLEPCVNDLRRWAAEPLRPAALFFHLPFAPNCGVSATGPASTEEAVRRAADVLLAPYLQGAKGALGAQQSTESVRTVARIAQKMHGLMQGSAQEPFWLLLMALCEALAAELAEPDECIARIFKAGAFMIKHAREHGSANDSAINYAQYIQQMLYYMAACPVQPLYVAHVWQVFGITECTLTDAQRGLIHGDALQAALHGAAERLEALVGVLEQSDLEAVALGQAPAPENTAEQIQGICLRLMAAGEDVLAEDLRAAGEVLQQLCAGRFAQDRTRCRQLVLTVARTLVEIQIALSEGLLPRDSQPGEDAVIAATLPLLAATSSRLNELQEQLQQGEDAELRNSSAENLLAMADALALLGLGREAVVASELGHWLYAAVGSFTTQWPAAMSFAQALAWFSLYMERLCLDPSRDAKCLLQTAESEVALLTPALAAVDIVSSPADAGLLPNSQQTDSAPVESTPETEPEPEPAETIPAAFREVFLEESQEIIERLQSELPAWVAAPARDERLREIRRHFHTFKGNGNAVGLYTLGDLGRDVQDLLDRVLESQTPLDPLLPVLLEEVLDALPELVASCGGAGYFDAARVRNLRNRCIGLGRGVADGQ